MTVTIFIVLMFLGWINIYAAVYNDDHSSIFDLSQRYGKQLIWIGAAIVLGIVLLIIDSNFYVFLAYGFYAVSIIALLLVLVIGTEINGSRSWFMVGDFRVQPSEFSKFATALALAKIMSGFNFKLSKISSLLQTALVILLPAGLILLQPDTGSAIVFVVFLLVMYREGLSGVVLFFGALTVVLFVLSLLVPNYFLLILLFASSLIAHYILNQRFLLVVKALGITLCLTLLLGLINSIFNLNINIEWIVLAGIIFSTTAFALWVSRTRIKRTSIILLVFFGSVFFTYSVDFVFQNVLGGHQQDRINELLGISSDPLGAGYNVNQSKIAIGSGGFAGKGFLNGTQTKFNFVPEQSTDFIFCTVGEEWGFLGSTIVIVLFIVLFSRLIILAERQRSTFSRIYGYAVATILFFHFVINIGMTIGLMPVIGIPLPFFSYGGSSLWAFTLLLFIFLRLDASRLDKLV